MQAFSGFAFSCLNITIHRDSAYQLPWPFTRTPPMQYLPNLEPLLPPAYSTGTATLEGSREACLRQPASPGQRQAGSPASVKRAVRQWRSSCSSPAKQRERTSSPRACLTRVEEQRGSGCMRSVWFESRRYDRGCRSREARRVGCGRLHCVRACGMMIAQAMVLHLDSRDDVGRPRSRHLMEIPVDRFFVFLGGGHAV